MQCRWWTSSLPQGAGLPLEVRRVFPSGVPSPPCRRPISNIRSSRSWIYICARRSRSTSSDTTSCCQSIGFIPSRFSRNYTTSVRSGYRDRVGAISGHRIAPLTHRRRFVWACEGPFPTACLIIILGSSLKLVCNQKGRPGRRRCRRAVQQKRLIPSNKVLQILQDVRIAKGVGIQLVRLAEVDIDHGWKLDGFEI
jgi:hypothetical protein